MSAAEAVAAPVPPTDGDRLHVVFSAGLATLAARARAAPGSDQGYPFTHMEWVLPLT